MNTLTKLLIFLSLFSAACAKTDLTGTDNSLLGTTSKELLTPDQVIAFKSGEAASFLENTSLDRSEYPDALSVVQAGQYILSTGFYTQGRYKLYDPASGETRYYSSYPSHPEWPDLQEKTKSVLYASSVLKVRPDKAAFVCADMYSGIMDICLLQDGKIETIRQLCFSYPKVYIQEDGPGGFPKVAYSRGNSFGFSDISVDENYIYALYSGKTYREDNNSVRESTNLLIFDWTGRLIRSFELETPLNFLEFKEAEHAVYGTRFDSNYLIRYSLQKYGF